MNRRNFLKTSAFAGLAGFELLQGSRSALASPANPAGTLRLNSNENPRGLSKKARDAVVRGLGEAGRYPFAHADKLQKAVAKRHGIEASNVVLGNGSSEIIQMAVQAFERPGRRIVMASPTFEAVADYAAACALEADKVPLLQDFSHDLHRMREAAQAASGGALVYLCNPNNPTGTLTPAAPIREWIESASEDTVFLVDEAYYDYVEPSFRWSAIELALKQPNVVVTRTFSKVFGMAGMRLGYGVASEETAKKLATFASDANTNHLALLAGLALLEDRDFETSSISLNNDAKKTLYDTLRSLGIDWIHSQTNFVMHSISGDLETYNKRMKEAGVLVGRPFPPMAHYSRVSMGLPEEMRSFVRTLRDFRKRGWV